MSEERTNSTSLPVALHIPRIALGFVVIGVLWLSAALGSAAQSPTVASGSIALIGGTVIDGNGGPPLPDAVVVIRGVRIVAIGRKGKVAIPPNARVIDTTGQWLLPGLIDIHVHYNDWMGEMFLAHGVTTVKDVGNYVEWVSVASAEIEQGKAVGPRLFYTGNGLDLPPPAREHFIGLESPAMARRVVQLLHKRGAIAIKVRERMTVEILRAVTDEAHKLGMPVTGHIRGVDARAAALAGIDGLEHVSGVVQATWDNPLTTDLDSLNEYVRYVEERKSYALINTAKANELDKLLVDRRVAIIPTLSGRWRMVSDRLAEFAREDAVFARNPALAYVPEDARKMWQTSTIYQLEKKEDFAQVNEGWARIKALLRRHYQSGGKVLAGSDTFLSVPGLSLQRELLMFVDAGFTPTQVLRMATRDNAEFMRRDKDLGTLAAGKLADIVVLDADPLNDIRNLGRIASVFKGGQKVDTAYHPNFSVPTRRTALPRPLWIERELERERKPAASRGGSFH